MTYRAGIGPSLAAELGTESGPPRLICDGCGAVKLGETRRGDAAAWLLNRRAPPGWKMIRRDDGTSTDYCQACRIAATDGGK